MSDATFECMPAYILLDTLAVADPAGEATAFQTLLALEKGYTSKIVHVGKAIDVVASDNRAIRFIQKA